MWCPPERLVEVEVPITVRSPTDCAGARRLQNPAGHVAFSEAFVPEFTQNRPVSNVLYSRHQARALQVIGEDASPGIKRGGYINLVRRTVRCLCAGEDIPASLEINVAAMDIGASVLLGQLPLPEGVVHAVRQESHLAQPLCKLSGRARRTD